MTTGAITFSGLGSGIDTATMIDQLVKLERATITQMEQRQSDYRSQLSIVQNINSKLQSLQTSMQGIDTRDEFLAYSTTSEDDDFISVTATGDASPGSYNVQVDWLAQPERRYSTGFSSKDTAGIFGTGDLNIKVGDDEFEEIAVDASDTMESIVDKINSSEARVTAGILFDGDDYYIQLNGAVTGEDNLFEIQEDNGDLALGLDDDVNTPYQDAKNAQIQMDGFTISTDSNEVDDVIAGVSMTLRDVTTSAVAVTVTASSSEISEKVSGFVSSYNEVMSIIHDEFAFTGEAKGGDRLTGDSTLRSIQMQLSQQISSAISDLTGSYEALSQIGITTAKDGNLKIDEEALNDAISADAVGVSQIFAGSDDHTVDGIADLLDDLIETFVDFSDGILRAKMDGINTTLDNLSDSIINEESRISSYETMLRGKFTSMEVMMSSLMSQSNFLSSQTFLW